MGALTSRLRETLQGLAWEGCVCRPSVFPLESIPDEIFVMVLSHVPARDLIHNCRLVNKEWMLYSDCRMLWKMKCLREGVILPPNRGPPLDYKHLCIKNPYGRNLLRNWNAQEGLHHWLIYADTGDRFSVETEVPPGAQPLATIGVEGCEKCWATSYGWCCKGQYIDLIKEGCHDNILDELQPGIEISVWTTARVDCASFYIVEVNLLADDKQVLHTFTYEHRVDQPREHNGRWVQICHAFEDYGPGVRFIEYKHGGMDTQYWAGHYGPKMAAPCVKFNFDLCIPPEITDEEKIR